MPNHDLPDRKLSPASINPLLKQLIYADKLQHRISRRF